MHLQKDQLSRIRIKGYKSIKECDITLKKINAFIGSNGAGKSNLISAFSLLQNILSKNLQVFTAQNGINALLYKGRKETDEISFEAFFGQNSYGFVLIPTDDNRLIFKKEYFSYYGAYEHETVIGKGHSESKRDSGAHNLIDKYLSPILQKQSWYVYHFHDTGKDASVKQEPNISNNKTLMYYAANPAAFLYLLKNTFRQYYCEIVQTVQLIAPYFSDFILGPNENNEEQIVLKWKQTVCDIFNAAQLSSDGTLRFICLAALFLKLYELQPATIIVDEPELGLHPYAITIFAEMARHLTDEKQLAIFTQSVELLNEFDIEDIIVADRSSNGSKFRRLDAEALKLWLDEDYSPGDLWKKNILGGRLSK